MGIDLAQDAQATSSGPLVSLLLIAYRQASTVGTAVEAALAQTYSPLEIVISDDASDDDTWASIQAAVQGYSGPHRIILNRNAHNLGIGAHLSHLVELSRGELLFVAAGDDASLPHRCERVVQAWVAAQRKPDVIASALIDTDASGQGHSTIQPSDLSRYRNAADWLANPPFVVGAAQAWTRRLFDKFGPLPQGVVAEDLIMVFRAIVSGGAITLDEPLVRYRRGGISRRRRAMHADDVVERLLKNNRHALVELPQLLADARTAGQLNAVQSSLEARLERERFIERLFAARNLGQQLQQTLRSPGIAWSLRLRMLSYAAFPWVYAPFFWLKRALARRE